MKFIGERHSSRELYELLHKRSDLRFPLEDYGAFLRLLDAGRGSRIVDVACGKGFFLSKAEKDNIWALGVDFSVVGLNHARNRTSQPLVSGDAEYLPLKSGRIDYVTCLGSLEHFGRPDMALNEMARVLKREGKALIIVPNPYYLGVIWKVYRYGEGEKQEEQDLHSFLTRKDWEELIENNGLKIKSMIKYNGFHHIIWYIKRKDPKIIPLWEKLLRVALDFIFKPFIPANLSAYFIFICAKKTV